MESFFWKSSFGKLKKSGNTYCLILEAVYNVNQALFSLFHADEKRSEVSELTIYVDADACPVTRIAEDIARKHGIPMMLLCDTNHILTSDYSAVKTIGAGADAVDIALINLCRRGDIVITQDYGVAALALGKGARAIHQSGMWYTDENIDGLLMERYLAKKARRSAKHHLKGPARRTEEDDRRFADRFEQLIQAALAGDQENGPKYGE